MRPFHSLPPLSPSAPGSSLVRVAIPLAASLLIAATATAQITISGTVVIAGSGEFAHDAEVLLLETDHVTHTDDSGRFVFDDVQITGTATLQLDLGYLTGGRTVVIPDGEVGSVEIPEPIVLEVGRRLHEHITVTASGGHSSPLESFGSVSSIEGLALQNEQGRTLGELLEGSTGVAVRSAGPGSARPIVRRFDGNRVLVMEDGIRTGDLSSQSPDHGVPVDPLQAERVDVVRGPATLLYGSNAIGGAVNVISQASHFAHGPPDGFRGQAMLDYSTADEGRRSGVRFSAAGESWFSWGGGSSNRTEDYTAPTGAVENSHAAMDQGEVGLGLFGDRLWLAGSASVDDSRYGVPFAAEFHGGATAPAAGQGGHVHGEELLLDVEARRTQVRTDFGARDLGGVFSEAEFTFRFSDLDHVELETLEAGAAPIVASNFDNRSLVLRGELRRPSGRITSRIGVWGHLRDYAVTGDHATAPPTDQSAFAAFTYNEIATAERLRLLFGARLERNAYDAGERPVADDSGDHGHDHGHDHGQADERIAPDVVDRSFLSASTSAGVRYELSDATVLVGTASLASRAPSLEELYNFGPHSARFEVGSPDLEPERSLGLELSLRRSSGGVAGSFSVFRYDIRDFVFGALRAEAIAGLPVLEFLQSDAAYQGFEAEGHLDIGPAELVANASFVDAKLGTGEYAPRIPPLGGQVRLDIPVGRLRLAPRVRWTAPMNRVYIGETRTDGYGVLDFTASWVIVGHHTTHNISLRAYNIADAEYRHHTSFIKEFAPQIGRGFRISYALHFF